jgi:hypothetical protein
MYDLCYHALYCQEQVAGNPVLSGVGADKVDAELLAVLPLLKDLDGAVSFSRRNRARQVIREAG